MFYDAVTGWNRRVWCVQNSSTEQSPAELTGAVVVRVVALGPAAADAQEGFVVIVLVPVEGRDPGERPLGVAAHQAGGGGHHLPEGQNLLEQRSHRLDQFPGAAPVEQLPGEKMVQITNILPVLDNYTCGK